jgi:flavin reductase (DIM6/NTAB) family NADH-FMN oxidoreductase RutF
MRVAVPLRRSYKLLNHGPTTLIAAAADGRANVMAAAWVMAIDFEPPKLAAVIAAGTYTRELIERTGEFVVSLPTRAMAKTAFELGSVSGRDVDKLKHFGLATSPASIVAAPLIDGCVAWLECRVYPDANLAEKYDLFLAEAVAAWADDEVFVDGEWSFPDDARRTIHHLARGTFFAIGEKFRV